MADEKDIKKEIEIETPEEEPETPAEETEAEVEEASEETEKVQEEEAKEEKKAFKKKQKADKKQDVMKEKIEELEDKVRRQMAEFENFRKRTEKEKDSMFESGARSVIEKILPIVDNFERGIQTVPDEEKEGAFVKGIQMIYKQLTDELDKMGVKPIDALGKPFDPNFHNAVMQVDSDEYETGTVAQELQKGYIYHDVVIRHSMVAVVK